MARTVGLLAAVLGTACGCGSPAPPTAAHGRPVRHWVESLQDPDIGTRLKAVKTLGNVGAKDPDALAGLLGALKDREPRVRDAAVLALLKLGPAARDAVPALEEARNDPDATVRTHAAEALAKVRGG